MPYGFCTVMVLVKTITHVNDSLYVIMLLWSYPVRERIIIMGKGRLMF